jgi:predicted small secreted protein
MTMLCQMTRTVALALVLAASGLALTACGSADTVTGVAPGNDVGVNLPFLGLNSAGPAQAAVFG